jgi:hypothetical protein
MPTTTTSAVCQENFAVCDAYGGAGASIVSIQPSRPVDTTTPSGSLPFTGFDVFLIALVALCLLAAGVILRVTGRPGRNSS